MNVNRTFMHRTLTICSNAWKPHGGHGICCAMCHWPLVAGRKIAVLPTADARAPCSTCDDHMQHCTNCSVLDTYRYLITDCLVYNTITCTYDTTSAWRRPRGVDFSCHLAASPTAVRRGSLGGPAQSPLARLPLPCVDP